MTMLPPMLPGSPLPMPGGMGDGSGMGQPPIDMMAALASLMAAGPGMMPQPSVPDSELDLWARQNYNVDADQLDDAGLDDLASFIQETASAERDYWQPKHDEIRRDARARALLDSRGATGYDAASGNNAQEMAAKGVQEIILPDPYIFVDKVVAILAGAGHTIKMPSTGVHDMRASQNAESQLMWWRNTWNKRSRFTRQGDNVRALFDLTAMQGVMAILTMPDSSDLAFPWDFRVVPFLELYPTWDHKGLCRVIRQYDVTVAEARRDNLLRGQEGVYSGFLYNQAYKPTDQLKIISWYDHKYNCIIVEQDFLSVVPASGGRQTRMVKRPIPHGVMSFEGVPQVPWIIVAPLGDLSSGLDINTAGSTSGDASAIRMYGPSLLFGLMDVYNELCRAASMFLTNIATDIDPATVDYVKRENETPPPIDNSPGARNVREVGEDVKPVAKAANPMNTQPYLALLTDRVLKIMLPDAMWGVTESGASGYQVRLLQSVAKQKLLPYITAFEAVMEMTLKRAAEIHYHILRKTVPPLQIAAPRPGFSRLITGQTFDSSFLENLGTDVVVKFGEVMPEDRAAVISYVTTAKQAGLMSGYTGMDELGIQDPLAEFIRIARESILMNPQIAQILGPLAVEMSDEELLMSAMNIVVQQAQAQQQAMAAAQGQPGGPGQGPVPGPMPTQTLPLEQQANTNGGRAGMAPAQQGNPQQAIRQRLAELLAQVGGSQPGPQ